MKTLIPKLSYLLAIGAICASSGCSYKNLVINSSFVMVEEAVLSFYAETDTILAAQAAPANLKLIEGMALGAPDNLEIQLATAQLIGMYTFGFLEDSTDDEQLQLINNERARKLYLRAMDYAIEVLQDEADFESMMTQDLQAFEAGLKEFDDDQVPELFWTALTWGLYINLSRSDIAAVADMPKVAAMARRIVELDEGYFFGGAHMSLMVYHGTLAKALGGNPDEAKAAFEKAWKAGNGQYLMTKYMFAKTYCLQTFDRDLFEKVLGEIIDAPDDLLPEQGLSNALAKEKAQRLLSRADDIF